MFSWCPLAEFCRVGPSPVSSSSFSSPCMTGGTLHRSLHLPQPLHSPPSPFLPLHRRLLLLLLLFLFRFLLFPLLLLWLTPLFLRSLPLNLNLKHLLIKFCAIASSSLYTTIRAHLPSGSQFVKFLDCPLYLCGLLMSATGCRNFSWRTRQDFLLSVSSRWLLIAFLLLDVCM